MDYLVTTTCECGLVIKHRAGFIPKCRHHGPLKPKSSWVRLVRLLRQPTDKGVGDTVQRIAAKFGGERFKAWSKKLGIPCGCTERQAEWNQRWPY